MRLRGLEQFCSVQGGRAREYVDISSLANVAMDKIGQILKDAKMTSISKQNVLAGRITIGGGHFTSISLPF